MNECKHENWEIRPEDMWGRGWCHDCKKYIGLAILFDNLRKRMQDSMYKVIESHEQHYHEVDD